MRALPIPSATPVFRPSSDGEPLPGTDGARFAFGLSVPRYVALPRQKASAWADYIPIGASEAVSIHCQGDGGGKRPASSSPQDRIRRLLLPILLPDLQGFRSIDLLCGREDSIIGVMAESWPGPSHASSIIIKLCTSAACFAYLRTVPMFIVTLPSAHVHLSLFCQVPLNLQPIVLRVHSA